MFGFGITARINRQTNTNKRIGGERVIVERDDPEPAALETVVERALVIGDRQRIVSFIERRHIDHMGKESPRMMFEPAWIVAQAKMVRENAFVPGAIDEVAGANLLRRWMSRLLPPA